MKNILLLTALFHLSTATITAQTTIPDANFEQVLINLGYDTGIPDGSVPTANIDTIIDLSLFNSSITSLTGIEDFTALVELDCSNNLITDLDVSQNANLKFLGSGNNPFLTSLDVSQNTALTFLSCNLNPQLESLDVRNGNNVNFTFFSTIISPKLKCIYVDDKNAPHLSTWIKDATSNFVNDSLDCQIITSISEYQANNPVKIYPNPAANYVVFEFDKVPVQLIIYDQQNRVVLDKIINETSYRITTKDFNKGLYICNSIYKNETYKEKLIITK